MRFSKGALMIAGWVAMEVSAQTAKPTLNLPARELQGETAVTALGRRLPAVAAAYGQTATRFANMLRRDARMRLDRRGRLFAVEELDATHIRAMAAEAALPEAAEATAAVDTSKTFLLHSRAGARRTIYLNFKGATLTNTVWVEGSFKAPAFSLDSDLGTFSAKEHKMIQGIWRRVAEDYAPFEVDVTTEAPSRGKLTRSSSADLAYGTTVLITRSEGLYSCSCGGVSYIGVFDDIGDDYKPALVFYDMLSGEKNLAEAASHEAGHNLGLHHDGDDQTNYYEGHGSGATSWAPIMGASYTAKVTQWSRGEYAGANNLEDDLAVMAQHGLPRRRDDHGNTPAQATALTITESETGITLSGQGVIERSNDVDVFHFDATAGAGLSLSVQPETDAPNLDVFIRLLDADGSVVAKSKPAATLSASLQLTLPHTGTYYLAVRNSGYGDPLTNGYSTYGSLGQYTISATLTPP